ncbi:MAG: biotin-dependent carboxyltransferase family protein [Halioglobus sp.]
MSFTVTQPGILSLIQDAGRFGQHKIGLTTGGPLDPEAFNWCNRLLQNTANSSALEVSFGGLHLQANVDTFICVTGADMPLRINHREQALWCVHRVQAGDEIELAYAQSGCRSYFGVADGFNITPSFGSSATVMREKLGGLHGDKIHSGDTLPCAPVINRSALHLPKAIQPKYHNGITVRVIPGYQDHQFNRLQQRRFFGSQYTVSDRCDRMGYRLEGPAIECEVEGILSEGICQGAIQIPADGQPIVLLNDRQTIGGYPKIGSALSLDVASLAQLTPGATVYFAPISVHAAHNALHLHHSRYQRSQPKEQSQ